jgi:glycosyltransferase involved in cell wall biosynthesis
VSVRLDVVVDLVDRGGAETQLLTLVRAGDPAAVVPRLICLRRAGELADDFRTAGCEVVVLGAVQSRLRRLAALARLVRDADVVLVPNHHRAALTLGRVAAALARVPSVVAVHDTGLGGRRSLPRDVVATLAVSRALVVLSASHAEHLRRRDGVGRRPWSRTAVHVVPNGVPAAEIPTAGEVAALRDELGLRPGDAVVAMVGRLAAEKDHPTALRALARVVGTHPEVRLVIAGDGPRRDELARLADGLGVADHVVLAGARSDVPRLLGAATVFCHSSRDEAAPLAVLEAMTAGLPVVCTDCGMLPDLVADGTEGYVVGVGDDEALAGRLAALLDDDGLRARLGRAAGEQAAREYAAARMARRYEALVISLSRRRATGATAGSRSTSWRRAG